MSETFDDWWEKETPELGIDLILATRSKSKKGILTRNMIPNTLKCSNKHLSIIQFIK